MTDNEKSPATAMSDDEIIKALEFCLSDEVGLCHICPLDGECNGDINILLKYALDLINRLQTDQEALIAGQETLQKALAEKNEEFENQSQNFKVLVSDHRTLQQSFDNLKCLYESEKAKVEKAKKKSIHFAKELQTAMKEIERLKNECFCIANERDAIGDCMNEAVEEAKAEVIKEFAERLKTEQSFYDGQETRIYLTEKDLDNLVKEMAGDAE